MKPEDVITELTFQLWAALGSGVLALAALQFAIGTWLKSRLEGSINHEYDKRLEEFKFQMKVREQAARVAEYMAHASQLKADSPAQDYEKANRMALELAMWLPADTYKHLGPAMANPSKQANPSTVAIDVRRILLGDKAGDLTSENVLCHAPGIGRQKHI